MYKYIDFKKILGKFSYVLFRRVFIIFIKNVNMYEKIHTIYE